MGLKDWFKNSFTEEQDDNGYDDVYEEEEVVAQPESAQPKPSSALAPAPRMRAGGSIIVVLRPERSEESRIIINELLSQKAVIMNFEGTDTTVANEIVQAVGGAVYALKGEIEKIDDHVFLCTPAHIHIEKPVTAFGTTEMPSNLTFNAGQ